MVTGTIKDARCYSLMADKVTDSSNREQVAICLCWVDEKFDAHEDFIGLHIVGSIGIEGCFVEVKFTCC